MSVSIKFTSVDPRVVPGKLADAELHFNGGELHGLKLIGFSVWARRGGQRRTVSFPGRQYRVGEERRTFALLRPIGSPDAQDRVREMVLDAYARFAGDPDHLTPDAEPL